MSLLIDNAVIFTNDEQNRVLWDHAVAVEGNRILEVGPRETLKTRYPGFELIEGGGRLLMPGFINAHMHFYGTYARGLAINAIPLNFAQILAMLWWKLDSALDLDAVYYSALLPAITAVKKGITTVIDHHASPNAIEGSLDSIEEALSLVGLRGVLCYEVSDRDGKEIRTLGLRENERYIRKCVKRRNEDPEHPFDGMVGLHASFTLDDDSLDEAAQLSHSLNRGCHIHLLEGDTDERETRAKYGVGVVKRLKDRGILGDRSIAAHAIYLDELTMDLFAETRAMAVHNPQSNMNNAVGRANIFSLLKRGVLVGFGTDGMTPDIKSDVRVGHLIHKHDLKDCNAGFNETQQMFLKNNAAIYRRLTGENIGKIEGGYLADMILLDYYPPTPLTGGNFWGHFLFGIGDAPVDTTIIGGKVVMREKKLPLDEGEIAARSRACAQKVWQRFPGNA